MPFGVTWSKRMSIEGGAGRRWSWSVEAAGGKLKYLVDLFARDVELLDDFVDRGASFGTFLVLLLEGLASARAKGRLLGRPKGVLGKSRLDGKEEEIRLLLQKQVSKASIAKIVGVTRPTIYRFIKKAVTPTSLKDIFTPIWSEPWVGAGQQISCMRAQGAATGKKMNALSVIFPYRLEGVWVFDDTATGLVREPFISGADTILD